MNRLSRRSLASLKGVSPELALVVGMVLARGVVDLSIISGLRTEEEQYELFRQGKSKCDGTTKKSYHQSGKAIDFIHYPFTDWNDREGFIKVWNELAYCAEHLGFEVGPMIDWDLGHFEIRGGM